MKGRFIVALIFMEILAVNTSWAQAINYWNNFGSSLGRVSKPWGMAYDASGNLYVVENKANRVAKFNSSGQLVATIGSYGSGDGQLDFPTDVVIDGSGNVWVTDYSNNRIQQFSSSGAFKSKFGAPGTSDPFF